MQSINISSKELRRGAMAIGFGLYMGRIMAKVVVTSAVSASKAYIVFKANEGNTVAKQIRDVLEPNREEDANS